MPKRISFLSALTIFGLWAATQSAFAQALVPHVVQLDATKLEQQGIGLIQEATQLAQFQQSELALSRARLATQMAPKLPEAWAVLGGLYLQVNQPDNGVVALKRAQTLDPRNANISFALGTAYFQQKKYSEAIASIQAGLKIKPNVPGALFDLGNAHLMQRQNAEAIASYEKAVAQDRKYWPAINNIGLIKYESGDLDEAIKRWQAAAALDPKAAEPRLAAAIGLYKKGDRDKALALGEAAIRLDSRYSDLTFLKENLWGEKLLADTQKFFAVPRIQATIVQAEAERPRQPGRTE
ncbi:tetratricopeptide repeat protein [Phormidesmis sp. 146-12]